LRSRGGRGAIFVIVSRIMEAVLRKDVLVAVRHEEIGIKAREVEFDMSDSMRPVNTAQHVLFFTRLGEPLKGHTYARHADHGVEYGDLDFPTFLFDLLDRAVELADQPVILNGVRVSNLDGLGRRGLGDVCHRFLACAVDGGEVEDVVGCLKGQVAQDGVDAGRGVGEKDQGFGGSVEELIALGRGKWIGSDVYLCHCFAGLVEKRRVFVAKERVGTRLGSVLKAAHLITDGLGVRTE
jgi:hypothetical protein